MTNEITAQDDSNADDLAMRNLSAALEAKDDDTDDKETDNETKETDIEGEDKEAGSEEGTKTAEEEAAAKEEKDAEDAKETEEKQGLKQSDEILELRGILRDQKRQILALTAKHSRVDKRTSKVIDEETGEEKDIEEELTPIEVKLEARNQLSAERGGQLEIMLEQMSDTKKWADVKEVVTEGRVDEIVDTIANHITTKEGGELEENRLDVENSIWSIGNPYKYLYDLLKDYHPDFAKLEEKDGKETETGAEKEAGKKEKKPVKTNASIGGLKGSSEKGGWTSDKIDKMDELDLKKVPKDVYNKYLRNELD